ncbi:ankyrin repeat-containing domain protein [Pestalotiopsis sp. NC0098]|nr:ankyrin repeat-containing domain protein [Pestalotiopsis sp. NC0098]
MDKRFCASRSNRGRDPTAMPSDDPESRNALLESLKFPFMNARYFSITHAHPGTCDWLFETSEFQTWRDQADSADGNRALWIKGEPGSGKSTMMKHTLEYCQKEFANHSTISHFFDSGGATLEKTMLGMLQSLVSQLLHQNGQLSDVFFNFFRGKLRVQEQSDWQWFQLELENFLRLAILQPSAKPLIILIDAIDECTELEAQNGFSFLEGLSHLSDKKGVTLRLCISSHSWHSLEAKQNKIGLALPDRQGHLRDISLYLGDTPLSSNHNVKDTILNGCKGNFLWVVMIVAALNRSHAGDQSGSVQKRLGRVPTCIEDIVDTLLILGNVSEEQNSTERTLLLQLVGLSNRPLRLGEVCAAIGKAFVGNETQERYITNLSEGLVIARKHQGGDVFVHFIHNMVNDYLLSEWRLRILSPELGRHPVQASHPIQASHGRLWACCLEQIQILTENSMGGQDTRAMSLSHPFLSYAADHMLYHAEMAWKSMTYREQIEIWLKKKGSWFIWMKKYRNIEEDLGLLHVVILDGLPNLIDVLLAQNVGIMTGSEKRDTLQALAFSGSDTRLLEILLVHGAVIDDQGGKYGNALQAALRGGDEKVVEFLLMNGAGDRGHSSPWGTGFDTALRMGNPAIIDLILGFGAEDDYDSETMYVNALQAAAGVAGDNEETMSLLVNRSADVNTEGGFWGTALQVAVFKGNKRIVQLLIDEGANINASVGFHGNALQVAAETGNKEIASLLINKGADPNAEGGIYGTAFLTAAAWGHLKVMDLLLSHGADIEAESGEIGNALCTASYDNNLEMVEFLLERGANPNAGLGPHGNPLQAAAITLTGRLDVVKLLIARGSDINAQCGTYGSALCAALAAHNSEIVRYLLKKGARTDLRDSFNRTALHYAVEGSSLEMIQELLNQGASPEEVDDAQARPLDVAIQNRDSDIIRLLFRHTENMPTMSANDWRDCLGWTSNSYMKLCISQPRRIERHGEALQQSLVDQLFPVIHSAREPMERSKIDSLVKSMSKANV